MEIYLIAIGGTGMAPLACLLQNKGHVVRGADGPLYPPMSTLLDRAGIHRHEGYDAAHLQPAPDMVIVGNAVPRENLEAVEAERLGLTRLSMPQALARFFLAERQPLVAAGSHGKTTCTAMAAWVWSRCGVDPGYLIGGMPRDLPTSFSAGSGRRFIVEGDEYNAAYFDRGPKFLHYQPQTLILTSVEYDHADLYPSHRHLLEVYRSLVRLLPADGLLVACGDSPQVRQVASEARCRVLFYGLGAENELCPAGALQADPQGMHFRLLDGEVGELEIRLPLWGEHNVANALAIWAAARQDGLPADRVAAALASFHGVRRRLEVLGTAAGITVIDDFAHHPTEVAASLRALRRRYPARRIVALFEPRTLTAGRRLFFDAYREAFAVADRVLFAPVYHRKRLAPEERIDFDALALRLSDRGTDSQVCQHVEEVLVGALAEARVGDVMVAMSSGEFQRLPHRLLEELGARGSAAADQGATAHGSSESGAVQSTQ